MNVFRAIRERLHLTQAALGQELDCTQGNISFYEKGQTVPPDVAKKLIEVARSRMLVIGMDHVYGLAELPADREAAAQT